MKLYKVILCMAVLYASSACAESLFGAVSSGDAQGVKAALNTPGVNINAQLSDGQTALIFAVRKGKGEIVKILIDAKANLNIQEKHRKFSALMIAIKSGYDNIAKMLIEAKADLNLKDYEGFTALMIAVQAGNEKIVKMLIDAKVDVNAKFTVPYDSQVMTALSMARNENIKNMLIAAGATK